MFSRTSRNSYIWISRLRSRSSGIPRFQSSFTPPPRNSNYYAALYGGLAGGSLVLAGTYAWYHLSGTRSVINTARNTIYTVERAKTRIADATPSDPVAALAFLRYMVKVFLPFPGADRVFDELEKTAEKHGDRVVDIVKKTYQEVQEALTEKDSTDAGEKILRTLQQSIWEIQQLSFDVAGDAFKRMLDDSPELRRVLGAAYEQFKSTADKHGPEAQRIAYETYAQLAENFSKGVDPSTIKDATELLQKKSQEISRLASKTSGDAWKAASNSAQPMLDHLPDLKKVLDENVEALRDYMGEERIGIVKDLYTRLEALSKSGKPPPDIKADAEKIVREKVEELRKKYGGAAAEAATAASGDFDFHSILESAGGLEKLKSIPGLAGLVDEIPRLKELQGVADKRGPEAKKLLDETYAEIRKVLDAKMEEAKKLGEGAKDDAKGTGKKR